MSRSKCGDTLQCTVEGRAQGCWADLERLRPGWLKGGRGAKGGGA
eukprot:COSAG02_NODE_22605_length_746_cov_106.760433_1_plen_44_part_10